MASTSNTAAIRPIYASAWNNPDLSEAEVPDGLQILFCFGCQLNLFHLPPGPDIPQECILVPWFLRRC